MNTTTFGPTLPPVGHPCRDLISTIDFLNLKDARPYRDAVRATRELLLSEDLISSANVVTLRASGELQLINVTPDKVKVLWNFGKAV